jgi:hypothetical protein
VQDGERYGGQGAPSEGGTARAVCNPDTLNPARTRIRMKDLLFVVITVAFFALAWVYAKSFDHL